MNFDVVPCALSPKISGVTHIKMGQSVILRRNMKSTYSLYSKKVHSIMNDSSNIICKDHIRIKISTETFIDLIRIIKSNENKIYQRIKSHDRFQIQISIQNEPFETAEVHNAFIILGGGSQCASAKKSNGTR